MKKSKITLVGALLALLWMVFCVSAVGDFISDVPSGNDASAVGQQVGTAIGLVIMLPYFIVAWIGVIFYWVGWLVNKSGFVLTAAILLCVSLVLGITYGFGLIPSIVLAFIGYSKIKKAKKKAIIL